MTISEIRMNRYIHNPNREDFERIAHHFGTGKIPVAKQLEFLEEVLRRHGKAADPKLLVEISHLFLLVDRLLEAQVFLSRAYDIAPSDVAILYALNRVFCQRRSLFYGAWAVAKLKELKAGLAIETKAEAMYLLICGRHEQCLSLCLSRFDKLSGDKEFLFLSYETAIRAKSSRLALSVFSQKESALLLSSISSANQKRVRNLLLTDLIRILKRWNAHE